MNSWRSFHLFYAQPEHADLLAVAAAHLLRELTSQHDDWFFIRYAEAGAHLRIRVGARALPVYDAFRAQAAAECARLAEGVPVSDWVRSISQPGRDGAIHAPGSTVDIDYVPETRRYGGPHALDTNEQLFRVSSGIALRAIELTRTDYAKRARLAIDLMLMTAAACGCCGWPPGVFFSTYAFGWKNGLAGMPAAFAASVLAGDGLASRLDAHRAFLASAQAPNSLVTHWGAAVAQACDSFTRQAVEGLLVSPIYQRAPAGEAELWRSIAGMVYSQIHMLNNRLGFAPQSEILWSESIAAQLGGEAAQSGFPPDELALSMGMRTPQPVDSAR
jgi:Lantibiotic biosynthesis dehydratase C-term